MVCISKRIYKGDKKLNIKFRYDVFETNSSAVHSISVSSDGIEPSRLPIDKDGNIITDYGSFGREYRIYESQEDKLSYLLTQCWYLGNGNMDPDVNYHLQHIMEAVCDYTGATGIKILENNKPEINHQEQPEYEMNLVNEYDPDSINSFIFNKYIKLKTESD